MQTANNNCSSDVAQPRGMSDMSALVNFSFYIAVCTFQTATFQSKPYYNLTSSYRDINNSLSL